MDKVEGYEVEIEYGEKDVVMCLKQLLDALNENCDGVKTEIEIAT